MAPDFTVTVGAFEGPLHLLLNLIEERKMLVSDVSLSKVADDFIEFVRGHDAFPAGQAAQFILTAATLLLLKSRSLLPVLTLSEEEEGDIYDLERRLKLYKIFRDAARVLGKLSGRMYAGGLRRDTTPLFSPSPDMNLGALEQAIGEALKRVPRAEHRREVLVETVVSLEEMMERLSQRIERALSVTFGDFVGTPENKREVVVGFLAVLELIKRGMVLAEQQNHFDEITMVYTGEARAPRYE